MNLNYQPQKFDPFKPKVLPKLGTPMLPLSLGNEFVSCGTAGTVLVSVSTQISLVGDKVKCPSPLTTLKMGLHSQHLISFFVILQSLLCSEDKCYHP